MALTDNLISYWKFDESSGDAADAHGSNTLTNNNTTPFVAGKINNAADMERTSAQSFSIADASQSGLDITGDFSIQMWLKVEADPTGVAYVLQDKRAGDTGGYSVRYADDGAIRLIARWKDGANASEGHIDQTLTAGSWFHVVFAINTDGPNGTIYVNGSGTALTMDATAATVISNTAAAFVLGDQPTPAGNSYDGLMDEVGIWDRVLTSDEVTELYNGGAGLAYPFTTASSKNFGTLGVGT